VAGGVAAAGGSAGLSLLPAIVAEPAAGSVLFFLQPATDTSESAATSAIEIFFIYISVVTLFAIVVRHRPRRSSKTTS
jgi:hypothetical protein